MCRITCYASREHNNDLPKISGREQEVLALISWGNTTKEIANSLYLSEATIDTHRRNLMMKLKCRNMAGLVRKGFEIGLLS